MNTPVARRDLSELRQNPRVILSRWEKLTGKKPALVERVGQFLGGGIEAVAGDA